MTEITKKTNDELKHRQQLLNFELQALDEQGRKLRAELAQISAELDRRFATADGGVQFTVPISPEQPSPRHVAFAADAIAKNIC